jgi:hypothetical protein
MKFETKELLKKADTLRVDEASVNSAERIFDTEVTAGAFFEDLKQRLRDLSEWNKNSGLSSYESYDETGQMRDDSKIVEHAFVKIALAGAGKPDWVRIEKINENTDELVITAKPTFDPTKTPHKTGEISHFFAARARNNFCAYCEGKVVHVYVIGLHETPNIGHASGILETARNAAVANLGYYLGVQKVEWTKFCESFLSDANAARQ